MERWLWAFIGMLVVLVLLLLALLVKIHILQRAAREIAAAFADKLVTETNTLIDLSTGDPSMRDLASAINAQLRILRAQRHRFRQGDMELKHAVTNISHDLRTPLTAICGYLDLLEQEELSETAAAYLGIIRNRADLMTQLTEELFQYSVLLSSRNEMAHTPVVINDVLEESIAAFYTALHARGMTPTIQMPQAKVVRILDRSALARVFSNLLTNAIKYSDGDLDITLLETGEITFTNTASGLNQLQVGKLFDRFYTVEAARKSTGLGLTIARTLTEQMNGTITAKYEGGRLCLCIRFPQADATATYDRSRDE